MLALALALVAAQKPVLVVVPLGDTSSDLVRFVAESIEDRMNVEVRVADPIPHPTEAWYAPRKRWRADRILDHLDEQDFGPNVWRVAAITEQPISTTKGEVYDWGIAGLGSLGGKSSVFTSYLFRGFRKKSRPTYLRFMENLVLHEVGHTLGLDHCPLERCMMADAKGNAIAAAKASINEFCPRCHARIREHLKATEPRGEWSTAERAQIGLPRS
jgi:archaemetzincin